MFLDNNKYIWFGGNFSLENLFIFTRNCGFPYILVPSQSCGFVHSTLKAHTTNLYIDYKTLVHNKYGLHLMKLDLYIFNTHLENQLTLALLNKLNRK